MPENGNAVVEDTIIQEQTQTIKTLADQLKESGQGTPQPQIIYTPKNGNGKVNWVILIGIGVAVFFFMKR